MKKLLFVGALVASLSSCKTALPGYATGVTSEGKTGVAEAKSFLGFFLGDSDISQEKAAKNGGIKNISTVDQEIKAGLFITKYRTIVTGK